MTPLLWVLILYMSEFHYWDIVFDRGTYEEILCSQFQAINVGKVNSAVHMTVVKKQEKERRERRGGTDGGHGGLNSHAGVLPASPFLLEDL